jgi:asparagine N-glycosylation enzyme membrane subunit Stt3
MLREIFKNARLTYSLKPKYYRLTSSVGLIGCIAGLALAIYMTMLGFSLVGIEGGEPITTVTGKLGAGIFTIISFALSIYVGCVVTASLVSIYLVFVGEFSVNEAYFYSFRSRYPKRWFK